jgi:MFS transporter, FSR family, fosmidomycin resistance protein
MTEGATAHSREDAKVIGLVGLAHASSHFYHLTLPALFPVLKDAFEVSYTALGLTLTVFFSVSGFAQVAAGFAVDHWGPPRVLAAGVALLGISTILAGLAPAFWALFPIAVLAGIGNAVFHPADLAILTHRVTPTRMARAYSLHTVMGTLGWAASPVTMILLSESLGWRAALMAVGLVFVALAAALALEHRALSAPVHRTPAGERPQWRSLLTPAIVASFVFFALLALALGGHAELLADAFAPRPGDLVSTRCNCDHVLSRCQRGRIARWGCPGGQDFAARTGRGRGAVRGGDPHARGRL